MEITLDGRMILPQMIGVGRYLLGLVKALPGAIETSAGDDHLTLWLQSGLPPDHPAWGLAGERVTVRALSLAHMQLRQQWIVPGELRRHPPDLFHYPHFDLPWAVPGRVIATIHDLKYIARPDFFPEQGRIKRLLILLLMRFTVRRSRKIIAVSQNTKIEMQRWLQVESHKVAVISEGVDEKFFSKPGPEAVADFLQRYRLAEPYILFVGERRPHKNLIGLIKAFAILRRMVARPVQLVLAGKSYAGYTAPERTAKELGLAGEVRFLDYVPEADLPLLYHACESLALLSHYEGFGLPILEAMAAGKPVVAADNSSLAEVGGPAAIYVQAEQPEMAAAALRQMLTDRAMRASCIAAGLERARQFSWERCASATLSLYHEALR
jgi:glycosyltransferase involved in cell wall biosynthesis